MKALVLVFIACWCASAQAPRPVRGIAPPEMRGGKRLALLIGNDAYPDNPLRNAVNDARAMKGALEDSGFAVQMQLNATQRQMELAIDEFTGAVTPGDIALFFYAGHGIQISDQNYLIPVDFQARTAVDAKYKAYPAQRVQENLEAAGAAMQIIVLDACRNNPFRSLRGGGEGLAAMQAGRGTYIAFATAPGRTAADNGSGPNGLFTGELVKVLREPGLTIDEVFNRVRDLVSKKSQGQQLPWSTSSITGEFYFKITIEASVSVPGNAAPRDLNGERELAFWNSIKDETDPSLFEEYLRRYPNGEFAFLAKAKLNRLRTAAAPPSAGGAPHARTNRKPVICLDDACLKDLRPSSRVGIVDIQKALLQTADAKKTLAEMVAKFKPQQDAIDNLQKYLDQIEAQLRSGEVSQIDQKELETRRQLALSALQGRQRSLRTDLDRERGDLVTRCLPRMLEALTTLGAEKELDFIVDESHAALLKSAVNLTAEATAAYDKTYPPSQ